MKQYYTPNQALKIVFKNPKSFLIVTYFQSKKWHGNITTTLGVFLQPIFNICKIYLILWSELDLDKPACLKIVTDLSNQIKQNK